MYTYSIYNLCVASDIPFDDLPETHGVPDVTIRQVKLDQAQLATGMRDGQRVTGRLYYEPLDSDVLFEIEGGRSIALDPLIPVDPDVLRGWLTGIFMSVLLRQRGYLALHASAVVKDGLAMAFLGDSGWGKSTLAEYFYQQGYEVLTDDVLVLDLRAEQRVATVLPGHRFIRLRKHAGKHFVDAFDSLPRVSAYTSKRVRIVERGVEEPVPLRKLYILDNQAAPAHSVEPLSPRIALLHLMTHARSKDLLTAPEFQSALLEQCTTLLQYTSVAHLRRRKGLETLPELKRVIERDLEAETQAAAAE